MHLVARLQHFSVVNQQTVSQAHPWPLVDSQWLHLTGPEQRSQFAAQLRWGLAAAGDLFGSRLAGWKVGQQVEISVPQGAQRLVLVCLKALPEDIPPSGTTAKV